MKWRLVVRGTSEESITPSAGGGGGDGSGFGGVPTRPMATSAMEGISGAGIQTPISDMIAADTERMPQAFAEQQAVLAENRLFALQQTAQFNQRVGQVISGGLQNLASGMAAALGNAISSGGNLAGKLSNVILGSIGSMAMQLGKLAIGIGITLKKIKVAFKSLAPGVAIAAGIALVALGSFFKGKASSIGGGGGGGGGRRVAEVAEVVTPEEIPPEVLRLLQMVELLAAQQWDWLVNIQEQDKTRKL